MTDQYLIHLRRNMTDKPPLRKILSAGNADMYNPSTWVMVVIVGVTILLATSVLVVPHLAKKESAVDVSIFADSAAVSRVFDSMDMCEQHTTAGLKKASQQIQLEVDHIKTGLFYISANDTTTIIRCFPMKNDRHHIFIASSGHDKISVNTTIATLYGSIAFR